MRARRPRPFFCYHGAPPPPPSPHTRARSSRKRTRNARLTTLSYTSSLIAFMHARNDDDCPRQSPPPPAYTRALSTKRSTPPTLPATPAAMSAASTSSGTNVSSYAEGGRCGFFVGVFCCRRLEGWRCVAGGARARAAHTARARGGWLLEMRSWWSADAKTQHTTTHLGRAALALGRR